MELDPNFTELLALLRAHEARFLVAGVEFAEAYERRVEVDIAGTTVPFISLEDLRRNKRATRRAQDLADVEALEAFDGEPSGGAVQ